MDGLPTTEDQFIPLLIFRYSFAPFSIYIVVFLNV